MTLVFTSYLIQARQCNCRVVVHLWRIRAPRALGGFPGPSIRVLLVWASLSPQA